MTASNKSDTSIHQAAAPACCLAWNPSQPLALYYAENTTDETTADIQCVPPSTPPCTSAELVCLNQLVRAQQDFFKEDPSERSMRYRTALRACLNEDEEECLKRTYLLMQLSHVCLPPYDQPGIQTASFVRYLRLHHCCRVFINEEEVDALLNLVQPEQAPVYWDYAASLIRTGCLERAAQLLQKHSLIAQAFSSNNEWGPFHEIQQAAHDLFGLFACAPLPGSRNSDFDDELDMTAYFQQDQNMNSGALSLHPMVLNASDYQVWDATPDQYNPSLARSKHAAWMQALRTANLSALTHRVPQIQRLLDMILLEPKQQLDDEYDSDDWADALCAELLYHQPLLRPSDFGRRALALMKERNQDQAPHVQLLLAIMNGNAAQAVASIAEFGNVTGAALPKTIVSQERRN
jgi:hypothetical protein